jgi:hypothetical protein
MHARLRMGHARSHWNQPSLKRAGIRQQKIKAELIRGSLCARVSNPLTRH